MKYERDKKIYCEVLIRDTASATKRKPLDLCAISIVDCLECKPASAFTKLTLVSLNAVLIQKSLLQRFTRTIGCEPEVGVG
jgi:hypothetical protein